MVTIVEKGLGCENVDPSYNNHNKNIYVPDHLLCEHYGFNRHLNKDCPVWKKYEVIS